MKKRLLLLTILLLTITLLSSCILTDNNDKVTTEETTHVGSGSATKDALVFSGSEFHYTIVRPEKSTQNEISQMGILREKMVSLSGGAPDLSTDEQHLGNTYSTDEPEILIGYVSYPQSQKFRLELAYNEYGFGVFGNKIVITAWGDIALGNAVAAFNSYAQENTVDGELIIAAGYREVGVSSAKILDPLENVPVFQGGNTVAVSDASDGFTQVTVKDTNEMMLSEYCTILSSQGYTLYTENMMADNKFVTYTKDKLTIHAYYVPYSKTTTIIASVGAVLPATEAPNYTKVRNSSFTLFNPEAGGDSSGLGCMMQLEDGSFIIIDGGNNTSGEVSQIYNKLNELAPDKSNIIIRAWIITHAHGDHHGAFLGFVAAHGNNSKIKVESFIYNFCSNEEQTQYMSDGKKSQDKVRNLVKTTYPNAKIYKSLTGQVYRFAGANMEILYCMSDFMPQVIGLERTDADLTKADGNIQSIVVRFKTTTGTSQTIMVTGDAARPNIDEMSKRFGSYLKSDIMTVPHHGWDQNRYRARGGTIEFYTFVNPSIVLWPDGKAAQAKKMLWNGTKGADWENNYYLIHSLNVKKTIVSGGKTVTFTLPYNG